MISEKFIFIGVFLQFIGQVSYLLSINRGHAKPNLASWVPWMLAPFIGVFFQLKAGAGLSVLPIFMAGFGPFLVIIFSILNKNAYWKLTKLDIYCGSFALLGLVFYIFTHNLGISIVFAILSDNLAAIPTIIKSWKFPETENATLFFFAMVSNIIGLLVIKDWSFTVGAFGVLVVIQCVVILFCIYRQKIFKVT